MENVIGRGFLARGLGFHWWSPIVRGIIAVVFGIFALAWPGITLAILLVLFGIFALADGIIAVITAFATPEGRKTWWAFLLIGLAGIIAGILAFTYPGLTILTLLYIIATWAVVIGVLEVMDAVTRTGDTSGRWLMGITGVLSVLFGILLFSYPFTGVLAVVWLIGFYALVVGITQIALGIHARSVGRGIRAALQT